MPSLAPGPRRGSSPGMEFSRLSADVAATKVPIEAGSQELTVDVTVVFGIE